MDNTRIMRSIYLAGPIAGMPGYRAIFAAGEQWLLRAGWGAVLNPARDLEGYAAVATRSQLMAVCREWVEAATAIALLPGWECSKGVREELGHALAFGRQIVVIPPDFAPEEA